MIFLIQESVAALVRHPKRWDDQPIRASGAVAEYASLRSHPLEDGRTPQLEEESFIPFVGGSLTSHSPEETHA
jgi:hypothetical protein